LNAGSPSPPQTHTDYSTAGSALWISAPGGEFGAQAAVLAAAGLSGSGSVLFPAMVTTDQSGCSAGFSSSISPALQLTNGNDVTNINDFNWSAAATNTVNPTYNSSCNYTSTFNGTSSATPVTSGAIAVLLQANPALTWRDVKYILAAKAVQVDASVAATTVTCNNGGIQSFTAVPIWMATSGGFHFHPWYGFGKIDLDTAVSMAKTGWTPNGFGTGTAAPSAWVDTGYLPSATTITTSGAGTIPDCSTTGRTMTVFGATPGVTFIEAVQVNVCIRHPNVGELQFELINAANGEHAVILPGQNGFDGINTSTANPTACQLFLVNQFYGEPAASGFQLVGYDTVTGNTGTLDGWQIRIWGH
jgi:subtilisin-like proprotein convertase family protein